MSLDMTIQTIYRDTWGERGRTIAERNGWPYPPNLEPPPPTHMGPSGYESVSEMRRELRRRHRASGRDPGLISDIPGGVLIRNATPTYYGIASDQRITLD